MQPSVCFFLHIHILQPQSFPLKKAGQKPSPIFPPLHSLLPHPREEARKYRPPCPALHNDNGNQSILRVGQFVPIYENDQHLHLQGSILQICSGAWEMLSSRGYLWQHNLQPREIGTSPNVYQWGTSSMNYEISVWGHARQLFKKRRHHLYADLGPSLRYIVKWKE